MGLYLEILFVNLKTEATMEFTYFSLKQYDEAWKLALEYGLEEFKKVWDYEGDSKYWVFKSITDVTRR